MNDIPVLLATSRDVLIEYRYVLLFVLALIEGTWATMAAGVLGAAGFFWPPATVALLIVTEILGGYLWYSVGFLFGSKGLAWLARRSARSRNIIEVAHRAAARAGGLIVFAVKVTYSLSTPTLVVIGALKYNFRRFSVINAIGSVIWVAIVFGVGYTMGDRALAYAGHASLLSIIFSLGALVALMLWGLHIVGLRVMHHLAGPSPRLASADTENGLPREAAGREELPADTGGVSGTL